MTTRRRKLCLIDGNSYIHRAFHAIRELRNSRGIPTNAVYGFLSMLVKVLREVKPDLVAVVFDAGGKTFRHELYPAYKANRPPMPDDLAVQVDYIHRLTRAVGVPAVAERGVEADDLLATLGRRAEKEGYEILFVTGDKDIQQLVDKHASTLDTMKDKRVTVESFEKERGFPPERLVDVMALMGDPTDNIPGVPGIGPKTAEKLVREHGSLEGIYAALDSMPEGKVRNLLVDHREQAFLSRKLAVLKDDLDVPYDWEAMAAREPDRAGLTSLLEELEFKKFLRELVPGEEAPPSLEREVLEGHRASEWLRQVKPRTPVALAIAPSVGGTEAALTADGRRVAVFALRGDGGVKALLEDDSVLKAGFDLKASLGALRKDGVALRGLDRDILLMAYLLNPSEKGTTLADLARQHLNLLLDEGGEAAGKQAALFAGEEEAGQRAAREAAAVFRLAEALEPLLEESGMAGLYRDMELPLVEVLDRMERTGIAVDRDALRDMAREMEVQLASTQERVWTLAGKEFNLGSPKQLAEVLFDHLKLPPVKKTKTGYSTDEEVLTQLAASHEVPALLIAHRQLSKLKNTYVDVLPGLVAADGRVHTTFNQAVTATGRLSSSNPNLQNIPIRTEWGVRIRRAFIPRAGWKLVSADYSQIELRVLAHLSDDPVLTEAFRKGEDIHARTASALFGAGPSEVTKEMRRAAKVVNFGIIYGMSPFGLARELGVDQKQAKKYIDEYFAAYAGVRRYLDELVAGAKREGYVSTLFGRRRMLPELKSTKPGVAQFAERAALNTPIQGTAADLIKLAMIVLHRRLQAEGLQARMLLQIHDELLLEAPPEEVDRTSALVRECMESAASFAVPIVVDIGVGDNWGVLK